MVNFASCLKRVKGFELSQEGEAVSVASSTLITPFGNSYHSSHRRRVSEAEGTLMIRTSLCDSSLSVNHRVSSMMN